MKTNEKKWKKMKKEKNEKKMKKNKKFSNALSHHCTDEWITRPERPKGVNDVVKQAQRAQSSRRQSYLEVGPRRAP